MLPVTYVEDDIQGYLDVLSRTPSEELEDETMEFKEYESAEVLCGKSELAEEIAAIANRRGGAIIVGVRDSNQVKNKDWRSQLVGIPPCDVTGIKQRLQGRLRPAIDLRVFSVQRDGRNYVVIGIPHRRDTLIATSNGKVYIREGRSSRPMTPDEIQTAVRNQVSYDWTADALDLGLSEVLEWDAVTQARDDFASARPSGGIPTLGAYLEAIGATVNGVLTKGGLLFLGTAPAIRKYLGDYEFRFSWRTRSGELILNDVWQAPLWACVGRAKRHFERCNKTYTFEHNGSSHMVPLLDPLAFHEGYLNALVHRDYSVEGMVNVNYLDDTLTITSPGSFFGGITAENITFHEPRHRNRALARMMMAHSLVDRAGMGVLRMSLCSLRYGRRQPTFREVLNTVEVQMIGEVLRPPIFILTAQDPERYGLPELILLNCVAENGFESVDHLMAHFKGLGQDPWTVLTSAVNRVPYLELCGTKEGVFVRVKKEWVSFFEVGREFPTPPRSANYVALYAYLRRHKFASNSEVTTLLGNASSAQTGRLLREAEFVERTGSGPSARWSIKRRV